MEEEESRKIPEPIKREVRQRCGFGCVICGIPLYDYDHMIEYSIVKEHKTDNLTLLCDKHHREKTNGLLSLDQVREANASPYNVVNKASSPYNFNFQGSNFKLQMGDCELSINNINPKNDFIIPFLVNNKKLISFELIDGQLFFNLIILDKDNKLLLRIIQNEMVYSSGLWDIEFVGKRLKLREGSRKIIFDIEFNIPNGVQIYQGKLNCDGYEFLVEDGALKFKREALDENGAPILDEKGNPRYKSLNLFSKKITNFRVIGLVGEYNGKVPVLAKFG